MLDYAASSSQDGSSSTRPENLRRLDAALRDLDARQPDGRELTIDENTIAAQPMLELATDHGQLKIVTGLAGSSLASAPRAYGVEGRS